MIKKSVLLMMVVGLMVLTSCGVHIEFQNHKWGRDRQLFQVTSAVDQKE